MMKLAKIILLFSWLFIFTSSVLAATPDVYYPWGRAALNLPPSQNPLPGFGSYFTTISRGIKTALWNPATLGKLKLSEGYLSYLTSNPPLTSNKDTKINEIGGTVEVGAGGGTEAPVNYAVFFRPPEALIGVGTNTKEVTIQSNVNYSSNPTGTLFQAAQRINDWLIIGFSSNSPLSGDLNLGGTLPLTGRLGLNLYGKNFGTMAVTNGGKMQYTYTSGSLVTTLETTDPVWNSFLSQEATFPFTNLTEIKNNAEIQAPYVATLASQFNNFYAGFNLLPVAATAKIENDVRSVINADVSDQFLYVPNFDQNNTSDIAKWFANPDKYGTSAGYSRKQIDLPAGDIIAETKYQGFYSGNTARMDFGMLFEPNDVIAIGLDFENLTSAAIDFKGNNLSAFSQYRDIDTSEASVLLEPGQNSTWAPFKSTWIPTPDPNSSESTLNSRMYLEPSKVISLPKRVRFGIAIKRPILIAIDYESNQNSIFVPGGTNEAGGLTISNLNYLRLGFESQLFTLPYWFRGGTTLVLKPIVATTNQQTNDSINQIFKYGVLPAKIDFGSTLNLWGYEFTDSLGVNAMPALSLYQFDITNIDLSKMLYYTLSLNKDNWELSFLTQLDPLATASAYSEKAADASGNKNLDSSDLKFVQTFGVTYKF